MTKKSKKEARAETIYNQLLTKIIKQITGYTITYQDELNGIGRKLLGVNFKGVFASDKIPKLNYLTKHCILNLDKSTEPGSH